MSCRLSVTPRGYDGAPSIDELVAALVGGFVALWRGEKVMATELCDDPPTVDAQLRAGCLEIDEMGVVLGVHGLTVRPTRHRIDRVHGQVHTWCALDAIGIPAALGIDATAVTSCPTCGAVLEVGLPAGELVDDASARRLWLPDGRCDHLIEDFCNHADLYCSMDHLTARAPNAGPGRPMSVPEVVALGRAMWADAAAAVGNERRQR